MFEFQDPSRCPGLLFYMFTNNTSPRLTDSGSGSAPSLTGVGILFVYLLSFCTSVRAVLAKLHDEARIIRPNNLIIWAAARSLGHITCLLNTLPSADVEQKLHNAACGCGLTTGNIPVPLYLALVRTTNKIDFAVKVLVQRECFTSARFERII